SSSPLHLPSFPTRRSSDLLLALTDDSGMSALPPLLGDEPTHYAHDECAFDPKETSNHRAVGRHSPGGGAFRRGRRDRVHHAIMRSEEHTSELQSLAYLVCR